MLDGLLNSGFCLKLVCDLLGIRGCLLGVFRHLGGNALAGGVDLRAQLVVLFGEYGLHALGRLMRAARNDLSALGDSIGSLFAAVGRGCIRLLGALSDIGVRLLGRSGDVRVGGLRVCGCGAVGLLGILSLTGVPYLEVGIPGILSLYFDVFSGGVQALVFSLLTMVYIGNACPPPEEV